jgi:hypothetical protein
MNPESLEQRRAFNEQLRARLKLVAAERGDTAMKWLGKLRHEDLLAFVQKHGLSWDWVLCGDQKLPPATLAKPALRVIQGGKQ